MFWATINLCFRIIFFQVYDVLCIYTVKALLVIFHVHTGFKDVLSWDCFSESNGAHPSMDNTFLKADLIIVALRWGGGGPFNRLQNCFI